MSSDEEDQREAGRPASKRQRRGVACDMCRKRKRECDGKPNNDSQASCTNCRDHKWNCTFVNAPGKKVAPGYIEALETKVRKLQSLISRMLPGQDFTQEVGFELTRDNWMLPGVCGAPELEHPSAFVTVGSAPITPDAAASSALSVMASDHTTPATTTPGDEPPSDDEIPGSDPAIPLRNLRGTSQWASWSQHMSTHLGKSLGTGLVKTAFEMCKELVPDVMTSEILHFRSKVWERPTWLEGFGDEPSRTAFNFPDYDLMDELIGCYFSNSNIFMPILHRPTFQEDLRSGLHYRDRKFGSVVLLVCALGSRYSHDSRVLSSGDKTWLSAGWKWYTQTRILDDTTLASPASHLHVFQATCLGAMYMSSVSLTHTWMYVGAGLRLAVDIGAHKRHTYGAKPTLEDELYKRAFWILVCLDRTLSTIMGRPCCIQEEDFDLEMPHCCDDEYLEQENPELVAKQPSHKPSLLSYFVWTIKLTQIQGLALRTIYASTKAKTHFNFQGKEWLERTVAHFDSLLNSWFDSVPDHLRWDPLHANDVFFNQSAHLYSLYFTTQMVVHHPFMSTLHAMSIPYPSLAICTSAARSLTRVVDALHKRQGLDHMGSLTWMMQYAGIVTLVALGHARLGNIKLDHKHALGDVDLLISILRGGETRWRWSGRQADVVEGLRVLGEAPINELQQSLPRKRPRRMDYSGSSVAAESPRDATSEITATQSSPAPMRGDPSTTNWDTFTMGSSQSVAADEFATYPMGFPHDGPLSQSTGTVFGNIDFGALFGLGDTGSDNLRPWSPLPFDEAQNRSAVLAGLPLGGGEGMGFGSEGWSGMVFGDGGEDWQWMAPQQGTDSQEYTNHRPRD
ncbi:hypothetical protein PENSPDRAFT_759060 [Peniophora sp. CONT]|nr:hypothetical protein PENSPDRAFT_759060 [Peniophora sp. CONT]